MKMFWVFYGFANKDLALRVYNSIQGTYFIYDITILFNYADKNAVLAG